MPFKHHVGAGACHGDHRVRAGCDVDVACAGLFQRLTQRWNGFLVEDRDGWHMEFCGLLRKQFDMCSARGETRHGEAVEMT